MLRDKWLRSRLGEEACGTNGCLNLRWTPGPACPKHAMSTSDPVDLERTAMLPLDQWIAFGAHSDSSKEFGTRRYLRYFVGSLTVCTLSFWYSDRGIRLKKVFTEDEYQRRGFASMLLDVARDTHPNLPVDPGVLSPMGALWWDSYCRSRQLTPEDVTTIPFSEPDEAGW